MTPPALALLLLASLLGLADDPPAPAKPDPPAAQADDDGFHPDPAWKRLGAHLWFEPKTRRLVMRARVVFREGPLEHLLCLKGTKEHEAILATAAVPRQIHAGLFLTGAEVGHPVRFLPEFSPPAGTAIAIDIEWDEDGKTHHADARDWVLDERKKVPLGTDWVFAGSQVVEDPVTKQKIYLADEGDLVTVANFASALLDLPFASTDNDANRSFVARTDHIPPKGTAVTLFLYPRRKPPTPPASPKS